MKRKTATAQNFQKTLKAKNAAKTSRVLKVVKASAPARAQKPSVAAKPRKIAKPAPHKSWSKISADALKAKFSTDRKSRRWLEKVFWPGGPFCPSCGAARGHVRPLKGGGQRTHRCRPCGLRFGIGTAAGLKATKVDFRTWVIAIHMVATCPQISSAQMHRDLEVTQTTAWKMRRRLLAAHKLSKMGLLRSAKPSGTYARDRDRICKKMEDWEMAAVELALRVPQASGKQIPERSSHR